MKIGKNVILVFETCNNIYIENFERDPLIKELSLDQTVSLITTFLFVPVEHTSLKRSVLKLKLVERMCDGYRFDAC